MLAIVKSHQPSFASWDLEIRFSTSGVMNLLQEEGQGLFPLLLLHVPRLRVGRIGNKILHCHAFLLAWLMEEGLWILDTQDRVTSAPPSQCPSPTMPLPATEPPRGPPWTFLPVMIKSEGDDPLPFHMQLTCLLPSPGPTATSQARAQRC